MAATFDSLRSDLDSLVGLDLDTTTRDRLLNEGYVELCLRAEYTRQYREFGPTVAGQSNYTLGTNVDRVIKVSVDGYPLAQGSEEVALKIAIGDLQLENAGIWWIDFTSASVEQLAINPTPTESGQSIQGLIVTAPTELATGSDVPVVPSRFTSAISDYAASRGYGMLEDNPDMAAYYQDQFDRKVQLLGELRFSKQGRGVVQMQVQGYHF